MTRKGEGMRVEDLFNQTNIVELSFFNFRNAITAAYYANSDFQILRVNENFRKFFPVLGNVSNAYFPDVLEQLGVPGPQIEDWITGIRETGHVLIPQIHITSDGVQRVYSLLSTRTADESFSYLNGIQGQFVDRTNEWQLRHEREELLEQKIRDREMIEAKSRQLEDLATRLAKYLSPQIYESIFSGRQDAGAPTSRKNLTVFFSDIAAFADLSDSLEPERVSAVINSYLSEMSSIAIECGGTIDKFIG
ncbi:MAG TPA: adenylate/guanylate cyclase domain-containing protein, partial [Thermohalobaculum sp.]|nr:adenylate/guanylate cyclase domain-containing protein [Thermohalobaculum sp.]